MRFKISVFAATVSLALSGYVAAGQLHIFTSDATGFNTHSAWYDDGQEVTVVDAQFLPAISEKLIADIHRQTKSPITRLIITHPNPDKFNGISVFHREGIESIASVKTAAAIPGVDAYKRHFWVNIAKAFTDESYPKVEPVKSTFSGKRTIRLKSGETLTLFELNGAGISSNQTVVRVDNTGDLIVGDLIHSRNHAWLEGGIVEGKPVPTLSGWKADLEQLLTLGTGKVIGGRGDIITVKDAVARQITYLDKADAIVGAYVENLADRKKELADPARQGAHYAAIQTEFEKAFPDYAMPELIGYSVYGLVQQKLAQRR